MLVGGTKKSCNLFPYSISAAKKTAASQLLPWVGPFQVLTRPRASDLPNITFNSNTQIAAGAPGSTDDNPLKANVLTLGPGVQLTSDTFGVFIWCDTLTMQTGSNIITSGTNGQDGFYTCCAANPQGGNGGDGASGGGGGSVLVGCGPTPGGGGGDGVNGGDGNTDSGCGNNPGLGGIGAAQSNNIISRYPSLVYGTFTYDGGGPGGGCGGTTGPWGLGGSGGSTFGSSSNTSQGGGGGGAGPIVICCRVFNGVLTNQVGLYSQGGNAGNPAGCTSNNAQSGNNGNVYIFAQKMVGNSVGGFAFFILSTSEVAHDGVTILNTYFGDLGHTWDHS